MKKIRETAKRAYERTRSGMMSRYHQAHTAVSVIISDVRSRYDALDRIHKKRTLVLAVSLIIIADYLMICYHTGKNPFSIFPSIPVLDMRDEITVYLPSTDGSFLIEKRLIQIPDDREIYIKRLVHFVTNGSAFENTRIMSPIKGETRKVWIYGGICAIDLRLETLEEDALSIPGSEQLYRDAVKKTVMKNIKGISDVIILENGIPGKKIWETALQTGQTPEKTSTAGPDINN